MEVLNKKELKSTINSLVESTFDNLLYTLCDEGFEVFLLNTRLSRAISNSIKFSVKDYFYNFDLGLVRKD